MELKMLLEEMGHQVTFNTNLGEEAIQKLEKEVPDLILMDISLEGGIDGIETARRIQALHNIPIVFLTAYVNDDLVERAKSTEPSGYMMKPYNERELQTTIQNILDQTRG